MISGLERAGTSLISQCSISTWVRLVRLLAPWINLWVVPTRPLAHMPKKTFSPKVSAAATDDLEFQEVKPLGNKALTQYLRTRAIPSMDFIRHQ